MRGNRTGRPRYWLISHPGFARTYMMRALHHHCKSQRVPLRACMQRFVRSGECTRRSVRRQPAGVNAMAHSTGGMAGLVQLCRRHTGALSYPRPSEGAQAGTGTCYAGQQPQVLVACQRANRVTVPWLFGANRPSRSQAASQTLRAVVLSH